MKLHKFGSTLSGTSLLLAVIAGGSEPSLLTYALVAAGLAGVYAGLMISEKQIKSARTDGRRYKAQSE